MRATYSVDAQRGPGYGMIKIYDCDNMPEPIFSIKRMEDGKYLSGNGWRNEKIGLAPISSNERGDGVEFHVGPNIVNELAPGMRYQLILPGFAPLPLSMVHPIQSWVADDVGSGLTPPPPDEDIARPLIPPLEDTIYEGVQKTPVDEPADDIGGLPSGVASGGNIARNPKQGTAKKHGWLLFGGLLFLIWVLGGWFLWRGAINAPVAPSRDSAPFVLFPQSHANDDEPGVEEEKPLDNNG